MMYPFEPWSKKQKTFDKLTMAWNDASEKLAVLKTLEQRKASRLMITKAYIKWQEAMAVAMKEAQRFFEDGKVESA